VVFDFSVGVGGRGDHGQRVGGAVVCDGLDLFSGGVGVPQQGGMRDGAHRGTRQSRGVAGHGSELVGWQSGAAGE
jgi:hypothetical protein